MSDYLTKQVNRIVAEATEKILATVAGAEKSERDLEYSLRLQIRQRDDEIHALYRQNDALRAELDECRSGGAP